MCQPDVSCPYSSHSASLSVSLLLPLPTWEKVPSTSLLEVYNGRWRTEIAVHVLEQTVEKLIRLP